MVPFAVPFPPIQKGRMGEVNMADDAIPKWYQEEDFYTAKIMLGKEDFARIIGVSQKIVSIALEASKKIDEGESGEELFTLIHKAFSECVIEVSLRSFANAYGLKDAPKWNKEMPKNERDDLLDMLPMKVVNRVLEGVMIHAGN